MKDFTKFEEYNEIDEDISKSYCLNHSNTTMINDDIKNILPLVEKMKEKIDVIIGGPPCQGFSIAGKRIIEDERNK